ncbi:hypothetical protein [Pseudomonas sp.]|uniref:hypothetical protein n=1 Tax=Pseudomonas sp. TaxID=306 RepID=UPI00272D0E1A|nr:hypothetical protein [Pseudomonas sp.]
MNGPADPRVWQQAPRQLAFAVPGVAVAASALAAQAERLVQVQVPVLALVPALVLVPVLGLEAVEAIRPSPRQS